MAFTVLFYLFCYFVIVFLIGQWKNLVKWLVCRNRIIVTVLSGNVSVMQRRSRQADSGVVLAKKYCLMSSFSKIKLNTLGFSLQNFVFQTRPSSFEYEPYVSSFNKIKGVVCARIMCASTSLNNYLKHKPNSEKTYKKYCGLCFSSAIFKMPTKYPKKATQKANYDSEYRCLDRKQIFV
jgi:hypothetical protein